MATVTRPAAVVVLPVPSLSSATSEAFMAGQQVGSTVRRGGWRRFPQGERGVNVGGLAAGSNIAAQPSPPPGYCPHPAAATPNC